MSVEVQDPQSPEAVVELTRFDALLSYRSYRDYPSTVMEDSEKSKSVRTV